MENFIGPPKLISIFLEGDGVSVDALVFVHPESDEFLCGPFDAIRVAEDHLEFTGKGSPCCHTWGLIPLLDILPEMLLGGTGEMLYRIDNARPSLWRKYKV